MLISLTPTENQIINLIWNNLVYEFTNRKEIELAFELILGIGKFQAYEIYEQCISGNKTFTYTKG